MIFHDDSQNNYLRVTFKKLDSFMDLKIENTEKNDEMIRTGMSIQEKLCVCHLI